jgi:molybdopterin converting factor small subunit
MHTVRDLLVGMQGHVPEALIESLRDESAMVSIDQQYAGWDADLHDGAEVGILPPVSGG